MAQSTITYYQESISLVSEASDPYCLVDQRAGYKITSEKTESNSPKIVNEQIIDNVLDFCGTELTDDLALLSIRRKSESKN